MSEREIHDENTNSNNNGSYHYYYSTTLEFRPCWPGDFLDQFGVNICEITLYIHLYPFFFLLKPE